MIDIKKIFTEFWRPIVWTVFYTLVMWAVLFGLFNFDMFSAADLAKLARVELHGFAGLVFGILVLAAIPLYVATTVLTVRNKAVPIKIPLPNCFTPPEPVPEPEPTPIVVEQETLPELPRGVPTELRENFMRAKKNYGVRQISAFNKMHATPPTEHKPEQPVLQPLSDNDTPQFATYHLTPTTNDAPTKEDSMFPIPKDFDIPATNSPEPDIPVFADIKLFDDEDEDDNEDKNETKTDSVDTLNEIHNLLARNGITPKTDNGLIIAKNFAIAIHDDPDFWIADEIDWFAPGKQKPSPIAALMAAHKNQGLNPILYLAKADIMDLEKLIPEWQESGITVVQDQMDLLKLLAPTE